MNKIGNYWKNKKGMMLVWGGFLLLVLLMLAGMAIDLSYMYYVKNQLQVAADGAALAGAADLDPTDTTTTQIGARQGAWKIACRNRAATEPVFLVTDEGRDHNSPNCQTPPGVGQLNDLSNDPNGDIVIGNWNPTRSSAPVDLRFRPTPGNLLEVTDVINAVKAVPKRTGETPGMPQVRVYLGQIFRMIGINWQFLSARATAIATRPPRATSFVAVGNAFCPPVGSTDCEDGTGSIYPAMCRLVSPRILEAAVNAAPPMGPEYDDRFGWTSLLSPPGGCVQFKDRMCNNNPNEEICGTSGIWGLPGLCGDALRDYASLMFDPNFDGGNKEIDPSTGNVTGWWVMLPWNDELNPMFQSDPHPVLGNVLVRIKAVCMGGTTGCRGFGPPAGLCQPPATGLYPDHSIVIDRIQCSYCETLAPGLKPALVK